MAYEARISRKAEKESKLNKDQKCVTPWDIQLSCLTSLMYITLSVPIKKELEISKTITYKIRYIDILRFMASQVSILAGNLAEGLHNNKRKDWKVCLFQYIIFKDNLIIFNCSGCNNNDEKDFNRDLTKRFANTHTKQIYEYLGNINNR